MLHCLSRRTVSRLGVALALMAALGGPAISRTWTAAEVGSEAVRASHVVKQGEARVRETQAATAEARLPSRGTVSAAASYTYVAPTFSFGQPPATVQAVVDNNLAGSVAWRQLVSTFGQLEASVSASRLAEQVARLQLRDTEVRVVEEARVAFHEAVQAELLVRVADDALKAREAALLASQSQCRAGVVSRYDVLQARTQVAVASQACVEARRAQRTTRYRLFALLGQPDGAEEVLDPALTVSGTPPHDLDAIMPACVQRRYEVRAAEAAVGEARKRVDVARLSSAARLDLQSEYLQRTPTGVQQGYQWSVGFALSAWLADGGAARVRAQRAFEVHQQMVAALEHVRRLARIEISAVFEDLQARHADLATSEAALESATEAARVSRIRYLNGLCTSVERQDADAALTDAQGRCVRARCAYAIAWARWQRASGAEAASETPGDARPVATPSASPPPPEGTPPAP